MGNNESKPRKPDSECAEWDKGNLHRSPSKRRKTNDELHFVDEGEITFNIAEEENRNTMELAPNQIEISAAIGKGNCVRDREQLNSSLDVDFDHRADESGKERSVVIRKSRKHHSTILENKTKTETNQVLSVDEKHTEQLTSSIKMNVIAQTILPNFRYSPNQDYNAERENGNSTGIQMDGDCYEDAEDNMNRLVAAASAGLAKSTESNFKGKSELPTKSSSELPGPSLMQHVSTVHASRNLSTPSTFPTNNSVQSSFQIPIQIPNSVLVSNQGALAASNSNSFHPSGLTQPTSTASAFGNFSYSGNRLSSVTSSSILPNGFNHGNFSMNAGASATDKKSSTTSNGYFCASVTPSNSHFDCMQTCTSSLLFNNSQPDVSAGSIGSSSSVVSTSNSIPRSSINVSNNLISHTSLTFGTSTSGSLSNSANTYYRTSLNESPVSTSQTCLANNTSTSGSLSNITSDYLRTSPNDVVQTRNELATEVEADNMDLLYGEGLAFPTHRSSLNDNRSTNNVDRDCIFIRTSVGDTITQISAKNITLNTTYLDNDLTDENMGIILERPKYPRYATLASRERSFQNVWPATNKMSWVKLPEAGFVYTGTADCVRCYYCNGGLREWLKDDCPWTEHARYYPHCPHVRQNKGDVFVRRVRDGVDDGAIAMDGGSGDEMEVDNGTDSTALSRDQEAMKIAGTIISDQNLLEKASYYIKNVQEKPSFDAQQLAAIAFEIEEGTIVFNFEDAFEDDSSSIRVEVLTESESSDSEDETEIDGCVLEEENRILRDRSLCKVCLDATACVLFLECGHMIACAMCAPALKTCAVCRAEVKGTVRAIYSTDR